MAWWSALMIAGMLKPYGVRVMASRRGPKSAASQPVGHAEPTSSLPAAAVLSFLKETRGMPNWNLRDLARSLRISAAEAKRATALLEVQGYIGRTGDGDWLTTGSGNAVSGSKRPRFTPEAVTAGLVRIGGTDQRGQSGSEGEVSHRQGGRFWRLSQQSGPRSGTGCGHPIDPARA